MTLVVLQRDAGVGGAAGRRLRARRDDAALARRARDMADLRALRERGAGRGARGGCRAALLEPVERAQPPVLHLARSGRSATRSAPSAAVEPYVEMARALAGRRWTRRPATSSSCSASWPGSTERRPMTTSVSEFVARHPAGGRVRLGDLDPARLRRRPRPASTTSSARWSARAASGPSRSGSPRPASARPAAARSGGRRAAVADARLRAPAPPAAPLVPRPARHGRVPVHVPRGRPVPDRARHDRPERRPTRRLASGWRGAARPAPRRRRSAAARTSCAYARQAHVALAARCSGTCASTTTPPPATASRSACCSALLGREYERVPIDIFAGDTLTDAYAEINPLRETPVLELDAGERLGAVRRDPVVPRRGHAVPARGRASSARRSRSGCRSSRSASWAGSATRASGC